MKEPQHISPELLEKVEQYSQGKLPALERQEFESQMEKDLGLAQQVRDIQTLLLGIESATLKEKMEEFHQSMASRTVPARQLSNRPSKKYIWIGIAASVLITIGLFWATQQKPLNEALYQTYFQPDPGLPTTMSTTNQYDFYEGMVSYKQGQYQEAITAWESLWKEHPSNDTLQYFLGSAYLATDQYTQALPFLTEVSKNQESYFKEEANYYRGLIFLKQNQWQKTMEILEEHPSKKGQALLKELKDAYENP